LLKSQNLLIAIDGPASSGKGTIAKKLASHFLLPCLNTGALYRAMAYLALENGLDLEKDEDKIAKLSSQIGNLDLESSKLHNEEIGKAASRVAISQKIRQATFDLQRNFALEGIKTHNGAILEGRDIGTVICPEANFKFFITASPEVRAKRRYEQLRNNTNTDYDIILEQIKQRDFQDKTRKSSPLKKADDAITIDTSLSSIDEVFNKIISIINE
jgi:cytidylate kinase